MHKTNLDILTFLKTLTAFSVFVLCFYPPNADAIDRRKSDEYRISCSRAGVPAPDVSVEFIPVPVSYDFTKTTEEMMIYQSGSREQWIRDVLKIDPETLPPTFPIKTYGMTDADFRMDTKVITTVRTAGRNDRLICGFVAKVDVQIGYSNTIIIPEEYEKDSCDFINLVKYHEKYFIQDMDIGQKFAEMLRNNIRTIIVMAEKSVSYESYKDERKLRANVKQAFDELLNLYYEDMLKQQRDFIRLHNSEQQLKKLTRSIEICKADKKKDDAYASEKDNKRNFANQK